MAFNLDQMMNPQTGVPPSLMADPNAFMQQLQQTPAIPVSMQPAYQPPQAPIQQSAQPPSGLLDQILSEYQSKQQQNGSGLVQSILSGRFQPNSDDAARSITQTAQSYGAPDLFKPITPEAQANVRMSNDLAPFTQAMGLQSAAANLQKENVTNQFLPQSLQADINAKNAQAGFMNNVGGAVAGGPQGNDFLSTLPPQIAAQVKAISEGRQALPSGMALKTPYWQQMLSAVSQYDPNFDAINYNARAKTRASFTSGPDANNITALNTAMGHLGTLSGDYDTLGNTGYPLLNTAINATGNALNLGNIQTNTTNVGADSTAVAGELAKVFRSTGMSTSEIEDWQNKISTSASPNQSKALVNKALDLIDSRLSALGEKYNQGMGTSKNGIELLSPEAQKVYSSLRGIANSPANNASAQSTGRVINFADLPQ